MIPFTLIVVGAQLEHDFLRTVWLRTGLLLFILTPCRSSVASASRFTCPASRTSHWEPNMWRASTKPWGAMFSGPPRASL